MADMEYLMLRLVNENYDPKLEYAQSLMKVSHHMKYLVDVALYSLVQEYVRETEAFEWETEAHDRWAFAIAFERKMEEAK
ncbi:hypothetical protein LCGC14_0683730 [marine sediment metagenome]|uniref:Uncharacterized protein n=1 Tax=marine sediment metagenome TaxID=412755 RepID=A0A0F9R7T7_9ZZZZ